MLAILVTFQSIQVALLKKLLVPKICESDGCKPTATADAKGKQHAVENRLW